jgi:two-component system LytT family response regulator
MTTVLVVDDVAAMAEQYAYDLRRLGPYDTAVASGGSAALDLLSREPIDAVVLDLEMPGMDGFAVLRALAPSAVPLVVFVTAYDRYALQAFETHAFDYLLKPFSDERFALVLDRVRARLRERSLASMTERLSALLAARQAPSPQLVVRDGSRTVVIPHDEIVWIEAEDYCSRIHAAGQQPLVRLSLRSVSASLDSERFVRIHRSAIVNLSRVRTVEPLSSGDQRLVLDDGTELRVSRTYRAALDARLRRPHGGS